MVYGKSDKPQYIKAYHGCYDPLSYPLFFPKGEVGWNLNLPKVGPHARRKRDDQANALNEEGKFFVKYTFLLRCFRFIYLTINCLARRDGKEPWFLCVTKRILLL